MKRRDFVQNTVPAVLLGSLSPKIAQAAQSLAGSFSKDQFGHFYFRNSETGEKTSALSPGVFYDSCGENLAYEHAPQAFLYHNKKNPSAPFVILCESDSSPADAFFVTEKDALQVNLLKGTKFGIFVWDLSDLQFHLKCILSEESSFSDTQGNEVRIDFSGTSCVGLFSGLASDDDVTLLVHQEESEQLIFLSWNSNQKIWVKFYGENPLQNVIKLDGNIGIKSYAPEVFPTLQNNLVVFRPEAGIFILNFTCDEKYCAHFEMVGALQEGEMLSEQWTYQAPGLASPTASFFDEEYIPCDRFVDVLWQQGIAEFLFVTAENQLRTLRWIPQGSQLKPYAFHFYPTLLSWNTQLYFLNDENGLRSQLPVCFEPRRGFYALISEKGASVWTEKDLDKINEVLQVGEKYSAGLEGKSPGVLYQNQNSCGISTMTSALSQIPTYGLFVGDLQEGTLQPQARQHFSIDGKGGVSVTTFAMPPPVLRMGPGGNQNGEGHGKGDAVSRGQNAGLKGLGFFASIGQPGGPDTEMIQNKFAEAHLDICETLSRYLELIAYSGAFQLAYLKQQESEGESIGKYSDVLNVLSSVPEYLSRIPVLLAQKRQIFQLAMLPGITRTPELRVQNMPQLVVTIAQIELRRLVNLTLCFYCEGLPLDRMQEVLGFSGHTFVATEGTLMLPPPLPSAGEVIVKQKLSVATDILFEILNSGMTWARKSTFLESFLQSVQNYGRHGLVIQTGSLQNFFFKAYIARLCEVNVQISSGDRDTKNFAMDWSGFLKYEQKIRRNQMTDLIYPSNVRPFHEMSPAVQKAVAWKLFYARVCAFFNYSLQTTEQAKFKIEILWTMGLIPSEALPHIGSPELHQKTYEGRTFFYCCSAYSPWGKDLMPYQKELGTLHREFWESLDPV